MAGPYTITNITDVDQAATASILSAEAGRTLAEPSRVRIYGNRETIEITYTITVGPDQVASDAPAAIQATIGNTPVVPDNLLVDTLGDTGAEIVIRARNTAAAASREARVIVFVTPIDDEALLKLMDGR